MFKDLDEIGKSRDIIQQEITISGQIVIRELQLIAQYEDNIISLDEEERTGEIYDKIYTSLSDMPEFTMDNFVKFIKTKDGFNTSQGEKMILGLYMSCLLHLLTERNRAKGERTIMHVKDVSIDYLFYHIKSADVIIIENVFGNHTLEKAASSKDATIEAIVLRNIVGDNTASYISWICAEMNTNGYIGSLLLSGINGDHIAENICSYSGNIDLCILDNIAPIKYPANAQTKNAELLSDSFSYNGNCDFLLLRNIRDMEIGSQMIDDFKDEDHEIKYDYIKHIFLEKIHGGHARILRKETPIQLVADLKHINHFIYKDVSFQDIENTLGPGSYLKENKLIGYILNGNHFPEEYQKIMELYRVPDIYTLVDSLEGRSTMKIVEAIDCMRTIYQEVKNNKCRFPRKRMIE